MFADCIVNDQLKYFTFFFYFFCYFVEEWIWLDYATIRSTNNLLQHLNLNFTGLSTAATTKSSKRRKTRQSYQFFFVGIAVCMQRQCSFFSCSHNKYLKCTFNYTYEYMKNDETTITTTKMFFCFWKYFKKERYSYLCRATGWKKKIEKKTKTN